MAPDEDRSRRVYLGLARRLDDHIAALRDHPDEAVWRRTVDLLQGVDALHREGLHRLVELVRRNGGGSALDRAVEDPVVRIFLGLYDLAELEVPSADEPSVGFVPVEELGIRRGSGREEGTGGR